MPVVCAGFHVEGGLKTFTQIAKKRIKGTLLLAMLIIPFFLYAAAKGESLGLVLFFLTLLSATMIVAMKSA